MKLKKIDSDEIGYIFNHHIIHDFPTAEIRPLKAMLSLYKKKQYLCYGLYDNTLIGYAFFASSKGSKHLLLDYFAIVDDFRNKGYGSTFIQLLKVELNDYLMIAEVETVKNTNDIIKQRRIDFYLRNGFCLTPLTCRLFGVDYTILYYSNHTYTNELVYQYLNTIYHSLFNKLIYKTFIKMKISTD